MCIKNGYKATLIGETGRNGPTEVNREPETDHDTHRTSLELICRSVEKGRTFHCKVCDNCCTSFLGCPNKVPQTGSLQQQRNWLSHSAGG